MAPAEAEVRQRKYNFLTLAIPVKDQKHLVRMTNLLTIPELAAKVNMKPRTVKGWVQKRIVPFIKMPGGDIRFDPEKIESWLKIRSVTPAKRTA